MPPITDLIADPSWFPDALDIDRDLIGFARIDRARLAREAFLDERMTGWVSNRSEAKLSATLAASAGANSRKPAFIFHSAFCCSTLLSRALDVPGGALALKEPKILMDLANAIRVNNKVKASHGYAEALCRLVFGLLARAHQDGESVVVKPTNSANNLLPYAMEHNARLLILYGDLKSFLVSILKKGEQGRSFVRRQFNIFSLDPGGLAAIPQRQAIGLTDLQIAALVWRSQMELFQRSLTEASGGGVSSLDFHALLGKTAAALKAAARHLALNLDEKALEQRAAGEIFFKNAKFIDQDFHAGQRDLEEKAIENQYRDELNIIGKWAAPVNLGTDVRLPLPSPVLSE